MKRTKRRRTKVPKVKIEYTAFFALAVNAQNNIRLGEAGEDGIISSVAYADVQFDNERVFRIPLHAVRCSTREDFVDRVSKMAGDIYDNLKTLVPDPPQRPALLVVK